VFVRTGLARSPEVWVANGEAARLCSDQEKLIAASGVSVLVVFFLTRCAAPCILF